VTTAAASTATVAASPTVMPMAASPVTPPTRWDSLLRAYVPLNAVHPAIQNSPSTHPTSAHAPPSHTPRLKHALLYPSLSFCARSRHTPAPCISPTLPPSVIVYRCLISPLFATAGVPQLPARPLQVR
jgi:hypothetical protein